MTGNMEGGRRDGNVVNAVFSVQCKCVLLSVRTTSDILLFGKLNCLLDAPSFHPVEN